MEHIVPIGEPLAPSTPSGAAASSSSTEFGQTTVSRPRKGHKKSHYGCSNCRRRKIKCTETRPACASCMKQKVACIYPPRASREAPVRSIVPHMSLEMQIQSVPTLLKVTDMELFDHFRKTAYPYLPVGNDIVWTTEISRLAQTVSLQKNLYSVPADGLSQREFLTHAVLGLSASHISLVSKMDLSSSALSHRVLAVKGLNEAFSSPPKTSEDADALLAACYALSLQAIYIGESVTEFLIMLKGCHVILSQRWPQRLGTAFLMPESYCEPFEKFAVLSVVDPSRYNPAIESLEQLKPLCTGKLEKTILQYMLDVVRLLKVSSREGKYSSIEPVLPLLYLSSANINNSLFEVLRTLLDATFSARRRIPFSR